MTKYLGFTTVTHDNVNLYGTMINNVQEAPDKDKGKGKVFWVLD
jgi:hypothetical protein